MVVTDSTTLKRCAKCKQWFPATLEYFVKGERYKNGLRPACKTCMHQAYRDDHPDKRKRNDPRVFDDGTVEIALTRGYTCLIDAIDADIASIRWNILVTREGHKYAHADFERKRKYIHRVILERILGRDLLPTEYVDHINGDGLDNRRSNIRVATKAQNQWNQKRPKNATSPYRGVYPSLAKWTAAIRHCGKRIHLGSFATPEEAYEAYCKASRELHGEFSRVD